MLQIETRYGRYWDMQAVSQYNIWRQLDDTRMKVAASWWLQDRLRKLESGRVIAVRDHGHVERKIQEIDKNLRLRWEFDHPESTEENPIYGMYAIDRFVPELGYHWTLFYWSHTLGEGIAIRQILQESDMQRPDYHKEKKLAAEMIKERQSKRRDEMALEAVDSLTRAQCENFVAVEKALRTGEKINVRGKDAEILNRMLENTKRMDAAGIPMLPGAGQAINPGHNPTRRMRFGS